MCIGKPSFAAIFTGCATYKHDPDVSNIAVLLRLYCQMLNFNATISNYYKQEA